MSEFVPREELRAAANIVGAPITSQAVTAVIREHIDRSFELPTGLYIATAALYLGFIGVMAMTFADAGLAIPLVIFAFFIVAGFGTPALWVRMKPTQAQHAMTFGALKNRGIGTASGQLSAGAAAAQVLVLPVLIFGWGIAVAIIAALT